MADKEQIIAFLSSNVSLIVSDLRFKAGKLSYKTTIFPLKAVVIGLKLRLQAHFTTINEEFIAKLPL